MLVLGTLDDADKVLVDIGTGYFVEVPDSVDITDNSFFKFSSNWCSELVNIIERLIRHESLCWVASFPLLLPTCFHPSSFVLCSGVTPEPSSHGCPQGKHTEI